jgi:hypothetical protein
MKVARLGLRLLWSCWKREAQRRAQEDGVSLNHWLLNAVAKELGAVETASEFLKHRAALRKSSSGY